jgi:DNA gyrase subunit B
MFDDLKAWININPALGITEINHQMITEEGKAKISIETTRYADRVSTQFGADLLSAPEIIEFRSLWASIQNNSKLPITIQQGNDEHSFENYNEFYEHVMESSKKGIYIQRYKGLGEMNPEQLWDTTLNPEFRHLLKVTIDDAVAADETFSVLMGEQVEPRRKFINDNALLVRALDI